MSAADNLNGIQFSHHVNGPEKIIKAHDNGREVGELVWHAETGRINRVEVQGRMGPNDDANGGSYQHRGIATHMYNMAKEIGPEPMHSTNRTPAGTGWAQHVGGYLPRARFMP